MTIPVALLLAGDTMKPARLSSSDQSPLREFNANFGPQSVMWIVAIFFGFLLLAVLGFTSYFTVGADSEGVVRRFGKFLKTVEPGLHFKLPYGIDAVTVVPTRRETYHKVFTKDSTLLFSTDSDIFALLKHPATKTTGAISFEAPTKPSP